MLNPKNGGLVQMIFLFKAGLLLGSTLIFRGVTGSHVRSGEPKSESQIPNLNPGSLIADS